MVAVGAGRQRVRGAARPGEAWAEMGPQSGRQARVTGSPAPGNYPCAGIFYSPRKKIWLDLLICSTFIRKLFVFEANLF